MNDSDSSQSQQHLANQRTFLAWLRTCVAFIGLGFVVARFGLVLFPFFTGGGDASNYTTNPATSFETSTHYSSIIGTSMVILGIVFAIFALKNYIYTYKSIKKGTYVPKHFDIYLLTIALVILGVFIVVYLILIPFLVR
jgi:putative membrane protein